MNRTELNDTYGYNYSQRAVRDVREYVIPLVTYRVSGSDGRSIATYKYGDHNDAKNALSKAVGRTVLCTALKQVQIEICGARNFIYFGEIDDAVLQVDHRVPYENGGEHNEKRYRLFSAPKHFCKPSKIMDMEALYELGKK